MCASGFNVSKQQLFGNQLQQHGQVHVCMPQLLAIPMQVMAFEFVHNWVCDASTDRYLTCLILQNIFVFNNNTSGHHTAALRRFRKASRCCPSRSPSLSRQTARLLPGRPRGKCLLSKSSNRWSFPSCNSCSKSYSLLQDG